MKPHALLAQRSQALTRTQQRVQNSQRHSQGSRGPVLRARPRFWQVRCFREPTPEPAPARDDESPSYARERSPEPSVRPKSEPDAGRAARSPTPFTKGKGSKLKAEPLFNVSSVPVIAQLHEHARTASASAAPTKHASTHTTQWSLLGLLRAQNAGSTGQQQDGADGQDSEPSWMRLARLLLAHLGRLMQALAVSFCLVMLLLLRPRAVGADTAACQPPVATATDAAPGSSSHPTTPTNTASTPAHTTLHRTHTAPGSPSKGFLQTAPAQQQLQQGGQQAARDAVAHHTSSASDACVSVPTAQPARPWRPPAPFASLAFARYSSLSTTLTPAHSTHQTAHTGGTSRGVNSTPMSDITAAAATAVSHRGPSAAHSNTAHNSSAVHTGNPVIGALAEQQSEVGAGGGAGGAEDGPAGADGAGGAAGSGAVQLTGVALLAATESAVVSLFKSVQMSVVNISGARAAGTFSTLDVSRVAPGQGSGVVWDERGHVVTLYSCVRGAAEVKVTFADASSYTAKLVGYDAGKDVAVLRLSMPKAKLKELSPVRLGTPGAMSGLLIGSSVWAVGNVTGLDHTLTHGLVSGLGREVTGSGLHPLKGLIQTDAPCAHQAGGPLVNINGRMVGMVMCGSDTPGRSAGYAAGYALPIETLRGLVNQILASGRPSRPTLGVTLAPPQVLAAHGVDGVLILEVPPGSPAATAGLRHTHRDIFGDVILGDVIVGIEATSVRNVADLYAALDARKAGDRVRVDILRDGKATSLTLTLGERGVAGALEE